MVMKIQLKFNTIKMRLEGNSRSTKTTKSSTEVKLLFKASSAEHEEK
jgi:hypothetical protein